MGVRVLIAEDEPNIVESLSFILRREGHEVTSVADGEAALAALRRPAPPALLILDLLLPRRNGLEVLKAVKSDPRLRAIPVIMLTARSQPRDRALALEIGVEAYVAKPFSNRDIIELVRRLVAT